MADNVGDDGAERVAVSGRISSGFGRSVFDERRPLIATLSSGIFPKLDADVEDADNLVPAAQHSNGDNQSKSADHKW